MKHFTAPKWIVAPFFKILLPVSVLGSLIYIYARFRFFAPIKPDEEAFIWYGSLIADGLVPYRDFFEPKPPVIFFANAIGLGFFGANGPWFRLVPTAVAIVSLLFFYLAMTKRRVIPWLAALLTAQGGLWLMGADFHDGSLNDTETYGFAFTLLGFSLASLSNSLKDGFGRIALQVLGGVSLGLAVLSKELFLFSVIPAWLMAARRVDLGGWDWRNLLWSAVGGIGVGLLFVIYLLYHSALIRYFELAKFYKAFAVNYCMDVGRFPRLSGVALLKPSWKMLNEALYNFHQLAFVLALWALGLPFLIFKRRVKLMVRLAEFGIPVIAVGLGMLAISAGYCFWRHYFLMGMTGLLLLCMVGLEGISGFLSKRSWPVSVLATAALAALFFWVAREPTRQVAAAPTAFASPTWDPIVIETIERHSKPGDYVLSTQEMFLYVALNRRAPLGTQMFLDEVLPYVSVGNPTLSMEALRNDLEKHLPKVCFFGSWIRSRQQRFHQELFDPLLVKYHYVQVNDRLWYLPDRND
jgi:hypothetical protein